MAILVHLFGFREGEFIVAHCGRGGLNLTTSTVLALVTCKECRRRDARRDKPPIIRRPNGPGIVTPAETVEDGEK